MKRDTMPGLKRIKKDVAGRLESEENSELGGDFCSFFSTGSEHSQPRPKPLQGLESEENSEQRFIC
jgi:hypothetical protein